MVGVEAVTQPRHSRCDLIKLHAFLASIWGCPSVWRRHVVASRDAKLTALEDKHVERAEEGGSVWVEWWVRDGCGCGRKRGGVSGTLKGRRVKTKARFRFRVGARFWPFVRRAKVAAARWQGSASAKGVPVPAPDVFASCASPGTSLAVSQCRSVAVSQSLLPPKHQLPVMAGGHMKYRHLSRSSAHRQALLRNLVTSLFKHESIATTWHKAKEAQRLAEQLVTLGKKNTEATRRRAHQIFYVRAILSPPNAC